MKQNNEFWPLMKNNVSRVDLDLLIEYLKSEDPKLTHGKNVKEFEEMWSDWLGVKYSVMVNSGSSANDLTLLALKHLKGSGEIIVPPLTWVSDISSVLRAGFKPVFVDINYFNLAMNVDQVINNISNNTKAIFITHVLGLNALDAKLIEIANSRNILIIEDVCESHGARFEEKKCGSFGWASNFSFYYAHHMTTIEGGMVSTNDENLYETVRMLRSHGLVREISDIKIKQNEANNYPDLNSEFIFKFASHNMRPTEIQGILGKSQLKRLDKNVQQRSNNFEYFISRLDKVKYFTDFITEGNSNYALIVILKNADKVKKNRIEEELSKNGIEFRRGLSGGGNQLRQPYLSEYSKSIDLKDFPIVDHIHFFSWYIGNYPDLEKNKIDKLINILNEI